MKLRKLFAYFATIVIFAHIFYPISLFAYSDRENPASEKKSEHAVVKDNNSDNENKNNQNENKKEDSDKGKSEVKENSEITYDIPDEGDNNHPSGKDRSVEKGKSQEQGKSQSDPDGNKNSYGGIFGKDKIGYDGGLDKQDQDGNNGCGNDDDFEDDNNGKCEGRNHDKTDHPLKNVGGCDAYGSTGDKNGRPCDPGKNNASENGCLHGEPDCEDKKKDDEKNDKDEKPSDEKNKSPKEDKKTIAYVATNNTTNNITNNYHQEKHKSTDQVLSASTLASTGDYQLRFGLTMILVGLGSFALGLLFFGKKVINKVFNSSYQTYLYLYEA